jgi:hypothetical protein
MKECQRILSHYPLTALSVFFSHLALPSSLFMDLQIRSKALDVGWYDSQREQQAQYRMKTVTRSSVILPEAHDVE